jgi:hypothetical protein
LRGVNVETWRLTGPHKSFANDPQFGGCRNGWGISFMNGPHTHRSLEFSIASWFVRSEVHFPMKQAGWLRKWVAQEGMRHAVRLRFESELERLAQIDGQGFDPDEAVLIVHILGDLGDGSGTIAPFESLWLHARLFLTACLYVAVADGGYSVEQARHISTLASRLGWSARQLSDLEKHVLERLEERGRVRLNTAASPELAV